MPYAKSYDETKIFYVAQGDGEKVIIFVHGLGESHETWVEQIKYFSSKYKVIALDLRGHGRSEIPKKRITMEDFAEDVLAVLKTENVDKAHFVGYSMGALVVLETYKKAKEKFKTLTLEAFLPAYPPAQTEVLMNMSMDEIARQVAEFAVAPTAPKELKDDIYRIISQTDKEMYIESAEAATSKTYDPVLLEIEHPTLLIYGEFDFIAPPEAGKGVSSRIKNSKLVVFNTGHMPHREDVERFNKELEQFIIENESSS